MSLQLATDTVTLEIFKGGLRVLMIGMDRQHPAVKIGSAPQITKLLQHDRKPKDGVEVIRVQFQCRLQVIERRTIKIGAKIRLSADTIPFGKIRGMIGQRCQMVDGNIKRALLYRIAPAL